MTNPRTFQELATKAHDMEVTIANFCGTSFGFAKSQKDKAEFKRNVEFSKNFTKEAMSVFDVKVVRITRNLRREEKKERDFQGYDKEASHTKKAPGGKISIPCLGLVRDA